MSRQYRLALVIVSALGLAGGSARADGVIADLSSHLVAITSGFTGASVVLFGATEGGGDVIAVVRGPEHEMTVWRKGKVAGIWVNAESVTFANVPTFYTVAASRPIDEILAPGPAALYRIGTANLKLQAKQPATPETAARFNEALIATQQREGLFAADAGKISFLGGRLFRATIAFPANVPTGTYIVEVFLVRDRDVVSGQTTPLVVSKVGMDAAVSDFATRQSAAYGAIAVLTALVAGWLASLPFRGV
ncbi:MAG: TIGR02186 family protein [Alphaproteobacteria bacterium]|nr:TIGR02186 family protein [Alphaproteobacteria bacterium]MBV9151226.1 TIGR02186 family protein [Alphaproteobacteria bacterium]MBV9586483.1 TIGR02186 family protein [Alphaproteobacteria bacterium]MBV9966848.1 TIGR02186 family protein [Alphaproteobacteria bacterium]